MDKRDFKIFIAVDFLYSDIIFPSGITHESANVRLVEPPETKT